jgi:hypothetical protein
MSSLSGWLKFCFDKIWPSTGGYIYISAFEKIKENLWLCLIYFCLVSLS